MEEDIKNHLLNLTKEGLLIDISSIDSVNKGVRLSYYVIGQYQDMDDMYNHLAQSKQSAKVQGILEHKNKTWRMYNR